MSEKEELVNFLGKFDKKLWHKFKTKLSPYGSDATLKGIITQLIQVFVGDTEEVNPKIIEELRKNTRR